MKLKKKALKGFKKKTPVPYSMLKGFITSIIEPTETEKGYVVIRPLLARKLKLPFESFTCTQDDITGELVEDHDITVAAYKVYLSSKGWRAKKATVIESKKKGEKTS